MKNRYNMMSADVGVYDIWLLDDEGQRVKNLCRVWGGTQTHFNGLVTMVREMNRLAHELEVAQTGLASKDIEIAHGKATIKELCRSGRYDGGTEERGLNDMAGVTT
jgi:hypothetical protein